MKFPLTVVNTETGEELTLPLTIVTKNARAEQDAAYRDFLTAAAIQGRPVYLSERTFKRLERANATAAAVKQAAG